MNGTARAIEWILQPLSYVGELARLAWETFEYTLRGAIGVRETLRQMVGIGVNSMPVALLTVLFSAAVIAFHTAEQAVHNGLTGFVGGGVATSVVREISPALVAIVVLARAGSAMTAQIGTMKITEQLDALRSMGVSPVEHLVVPRLLASLIMVPLATFYGYFVGCAGGFIVARNAGVSADQFITSVQTFLTNHDVTGGLIKAAVFALIIVFVCCSAGLRTGAGAEGVNRATTSAVVISIAGIYAADYLLSTIIWAQ